MQGLRNRRWLIVGVALMLVAIFAYVATLDESDPDPAAAVENAAPAAP
jgi:hypothetical protein